MVELLKWKNLCMRIFIVEFKHSDLMLCMYFTQIEVPHERNYVFIRSDESQWSPVCFNFISLNVTKQIYAFFVTSENVRNQMCVFVIVKQANDRLCEFLVCPVLNVAKIVSRQIILLISIQHLSMTTTTYCQRICFTYELWILEHLINHSEVFAHKKHIKPFQQYHQNNIIR